MICGRVIIINEGKLVANDTPENLITDLQKSASIFLQIAGATADEIEKELASLPGIKGFSQGENQPDGVHGFNVEVEDESSVRKMLHSMIINKGWDLVEMRSVHMSLEDVFIKLVTREQAH